MSESNKVQNVESTPSSLVAEWSNEKTVEEQKLAEQLLKNEALIHALEKETSRLHKDYKNMSSGKIKRFFHRLNHRKNKLQKTDNGRLQQRVQELEKINSHLREILEKKQEEVDHFQLNFGMMDKEQIATKSIKKYGDAVTHLNKLIKHKQKVNEGYRQRLIAIAREYQQADDHAKSIVYDKVLDGLFSEEIPEFILRHTLHAKNVSSSISFRDLLTKRVQMNQLNLGLPESTLDDKWNAYQFADQLQIPRPWHSEQFYSREKLPQKEKVVIKPVDGAGSRGVYVVRSENKIVDLKRNQSVVNWEALLKSMQTDLEENWVLKDEWYMEELVFEEDESPARDLKFYSFYGEVPLVLEVVRHPELKYCWWSGTGERIRTGKYEADLFRGQGVTASELQMVKNMSRQIPVPFIRIDFLKTKNGLVFGEFTPKPGNYDEFNIEIDRWLGDYFLNAEARLANSLTTKDYREHFKQWFKL